MVAKQSKPQWGFGAAGTEIWRESKSCLLLQCGCFWQSLSSSFCLQVCCTSALSLVAYLFFRVPFYGGSSFHLGNTFTALTALLLDGVSGGLAGAIGLALADILAGDPGYAVTTFVLKFIIGITCGAVAHKAFKLRDLDKHSSGYLVKVIVSAGSGLLLNVLTDPFLGYFRNVYIFGQEYTVAQALTKIAGGITFVNSVASTVCAVILYLALRPALERAGLLPKGEKH